MTLLRSDVIAGPATHALVIGVGKYPRLLGGTPPLYPLHEGMTQLSSPPHSARAFARWLLEEYRSPDKPLASVDLYISEAGDGTFLIPGRAPLVIQPATHALVKAGIKALFARANTRPENRMIFFFCGHGATSGAQRTLLLEDYAEDEAAPLDNAIDFSQLYLGLDKCSAREQFYFIDSCRTPVRALLDSPDFCGDPVYPPSARTNPTPRRNPAYYATLEGARAYSLENRPSFFTNALLRAFRGAGSGAEDGVWRIQTERLPRVIDLMVAGALGPASGASQVVVADNLSALAFHELAGPPLVAVDVMCEPQHRLVNTVLGYALNGVPVKRLPPIPEPWILELAEGDYVFTADPPGNPSVAVNKNVSLPYCPVRIPVP